MSECIRVLPLRYWDDPALSKVCDKVGDGEFGPQLEEFARQLAATMDANNGIGLAAPQVGVLRRMFVMRFPDHRNAAPITVCNPVMVFSGANLAESEGCLSVPGVHVPVFRASHANMTYRTPSGEHVELLLDLWDARVAAHERDHLDGIMMFDRLRVSRQVSRAALREWEKEKRKRGL
jgi:peptide deformylase